VPKARIRGGEPTIPLSNRIREKLGLKDGDELEAHVFSGIVVREQNPRSVQRSMEFGSPIISAILSTNRPAI
jgi:hypothetical protein